MRWKLIVSMLIVTLFFMAATSSLHGDISKKERAGLIALYNSTHDPITGYTVWKNESGWRDSTTSDGFGKPGTEGTWYGVTVDSDMVTKIDLHDNNLSGKIPDQIGYLENLVSLKLDHNYLTGAIPYGLILLRNIPLNGLDISYNCGLYIPEGCKDLEEYLKCVAPDWNDHQDHCPGVGGEQVQLLICGQSWVMGHTVNITWSTVNIPPEGTFSIEYSLDNGVTWNIITASTNNATHTFPWTVPDIPSITTYKCGILIRIIYLTLPVTVRHQCTVCFSRDVPPAERKALIALYNATHGDGWATNTGWKTPPLAPDGFSMPGTEEHWYGITVLADRVTRINLDHNNLAGSIPEVLSEFTELQHLYLDSNSLKGEVPVSITQLKKLTTVDIGYNCLQASDTAVMNWLNSKSPNWQAHQDQCDGQKPKIELNRNMLNFAALDSGGVCTDSQEILISNPAGGSYKFPAPMKFFGRGKCVFPTVDEESGSTGSPLNWQATPDAAWLKCTPEIGINDGVISVSVDPTGLAVGDYVGHIVISDSNAVNSPQTISVGLKVKSASEEAAPIGEFSTPLDGASVNGCVAITGWALDDIGIRSVKIYREEDENNKVFIGDAVLVDGARPDVEQAYPGFPANSKAGWGYMMLTNTLPNNGNGTFKIKAVATDLNNHMVTLGVRTIVVDNLHSTKPFGNIDAPTQGGTVNGSDFAITGWVLTPQYKTIPADGSTIDVWIDGVNVGHPVYNMFREDVAVLFPNYNNSQGAGGSFHFDTTKYQNGTHTIQWTVTDDLGITEGIGSRYFTILNSGSPNAQGGLLNVDPATLPVNKNYSVQLKRGYNKNAVAQRIRSDSKGIINIETKEMERIELNLSNDNQSRGIVLERLPIGSTFDRNTGIFNWQPGSAFIGSYRLAFAFKNDNGQLERKDIVIAIEPAMSKK
ncbi:MAG: hypothetical protein ACM3SY_00665 [Candidatus Omnitrophota bacterium]